MYYLSPSGADGNTGTSSSAPWKTFQYAIPKLKPGDTLVLRNGTYTSANSGYPSITCGSNASHGTASQPITLKAETERQAFLSGNGTVLPFRMRNCAYWTIQGLRVRSADAQSSSLGTPIGLENLTQVTFKRLLVSHNNRYKNSHLISLAGSKNVLIEESEFYSFHRHAIAVHHTHHSIFRRNYFNSRGYADLSGGYASGNKSRGEMAITIYPGSNNLLENNISERNNALADIQAISKSENNRFLGNISLKDTYGLVIKARGASAGTMPHNTAIKHFVTIDAGQPGLSARSAKNTRCDNCSFLGGYRGIVADRDDTYPGDGSYSFYADNTLVVNTASNGITIRDQSAWALAYPNSYHNGLNFYPSATDPHITNERAIDPQLGACKVWIPSTSPLKKAGKSGADIGANVLYRYQNGTLTTQPLWAPSTGKFPCGAVVPGVNDVAGASCGDVHKRLNVNANGCTLASSNAQAFVSASSFTAPSNLQVIEVQ